MGDNVYIVAAKRTPVGKAVKGVFRNIRPDDMLAFAIQETITGACGLDPCLIEDAIFGCAMPEGAQGMNVARIALLLAGMPDSIPGMTINRLCCSGIESVSLLANRIAQGDIHCGIAGGVESMSMIPMGGYNLSGNPNFFNGNSDVSIAYGMGITAEIVAKKYNVSREAQDHFALDSHLKAINAMSNGFFENEILPYTVKSYQAEIEKETLNEVDVLVKNDEGPRKGSTIETLLKLKPSFAKAGTVTAANSSQISDGASCCILVSEAFLKKYKLNPIARFVGYQVAGVAPDVMGIGPVAAVPKVLKRTGLRLNDIGWIELNEAFAAQSIAVIDELKLDPKLVNPNGGAIALGHPLGATGGIRLATAINGAKRMKERYAMITMCIGTGMGAAGIVEVL
jgi:acetyl-CoA acyltransferase